jgi:integrase
MSEGTDRAPEASGAETIRIGRRSGAEVRELLARRGITGNTRDRYLGYLRRAARFCEDRGLDLDTLDAGDLAQFVATLPASTATMSTMRIALEHYWAAIGYERRPHLELRRGALSSAEAASAGAAGERADRIAGVLPDPVGPTWADVGYNPLWLRQKLLARNLSPKTASLYLAHVRRLRSWCENHRADLETLSAGELEDYVGDVPYSHVSRVQLRAALEHYWAIAGRADPPTYVIRVPKRRRMLSKALDTDVARQLEEAALARRDLPGLAVIIGLYLGLRRFEIAKLRWADFDDDGWVTVMGKGDVPATLPVQAVVSQYLSWVQREGPFVFPGRSGGSVNPATVWQWCLQVAEEAGLGRISTHVLRHTALTIGNDETGDLRAVQDFARHAKPETTAGYTKATRRRLLAVSEAIANAYRPPSDAGEPERPPATPLVPFDRVVAGVIGEHAVPPWLEVARLLEGRPGWRLEFPDAGIIRFAHGERFAVEVLAWTNHRSPSFEVVESVIPDEEEVTYWSYSTTLELAAALAFVERGEAPPTEPSFGTTWVEYPEGPGELVAATQ